MLARSTAWRQGLGCAWTKATVDQQHAAVADQQVGRLDVAVGQAGVPQLADDAQALVDDLLVHLGLAELLGAVEELEGDQVLALRGQLDDPVGGRRGQAGVAQQPQRIVLLLHQPADAVEGLLVLQPAVEQLPAQLVPAVRAQVAAGVQLAEQDRGRVALDLDPQRGRAGRAGQPERLDLLDGQAELILQGSADGLAAGSADVQVGAAAPAVADREHLVGGEPAVGEQRDGDPDDGAEQHVGRGVEAEPDPGQADHGDDRRGRPLAGLPPATLGHQRIEDADQAGGEDCDLNRRQRVAVPAPVDDHPERPGPLDHGRQEQGHLRDHREGEDVDDEMAEAPEHQQRDDDAPGEDLGRQPAGGKGRHREHAGEPAAAQLGEPAHDPVVGGGHHDGGAVPAGDKADREHGDKPDRGQQPADTGGLEMPGQWRRRAGGSPPTPRLANAGRDLNWMVGNLRCVGGVHGASGPVAAGVPPRAGFARPGGIGAPTRPRVLASSVAARPPARISELASLQAPTWSRMSSAREEMPSLVKT
jgi:hypothetical protein